MAEVKNLTRLVEKLRSRVAQAQGDQGTVAVGFTAQYALWVHERVAMAWKGLPRGAGFTIKNGVVYVSKRVMETGTVSTGGHKGFYWGPAGEAKFLEKPARQLSNDGTLGQIVLSAMAAGKTLMQGLLLAGLRLQREAQQRVPVEYGNLRASAFTRLEPK